VSDDADGFTYQPALSGAGRRRVPMLIAIPIVAGCAALGTVAGMLHSASPPPPAELPAHALSTSPELEESSRPAPPSEAPPAPPSQGAVKASSTYTPVAEPPRQQDVPEPPAAPTVKPAPQNEAPPPTHLLKTGSVDQAPQSLSEDVTLRPDVAPAEPTTRAARAKRIRRVHMRRIRPAPPGTSTDKFFSSLFPVMPK
jgi:hypothetical protein